MRTMILDVHIMEDGSHKVEQISKRMKRLKVQSKEENKSSVRKRGRTTS